MQVVKNSVVAFNYTLTDPAGQVLDSSQGREPLTYIHGIGQIIPGLEKHMEGKAAGAAFKVTVSPEEGYGVRDDRAVQQVPKAAFQGAGEIKAGMQFRAQGPQGQQQVVTVTKIEGDTVTVDGNHPLAGVSLNFDVAVVEVREATKEELEHGHVHGAGGHHH
jgi:FKBP-type peptidyl-prolyl cis-trans isomerase SlyD